MSVIDDVRREREDLARVLKKHRGIRKVVENLYPDSAHFIYELLQNAEDTGATEASFALHQTSLVFEHNGRSFEKRDIEAITDIGEGTKADDDDKIGRFGVGFKAVFAYSETPRVWSPTFSFEITELVLPCELDTKSELGKNTRFEFPFNNPKKTTSAACEEIANGLNKLAETTLLFLSHLRSVRLQIGESVFGEIVRVTHSENHFEVVKTVNGEPTASSHFLYFDRPVEELPKHRVAVAFALDFLPKFESFNPQKSLAEQMKIVPANPGRVAVFFPAEKETSGLRFHLHAPFVPELSRASIKETPANNPLFQQLEKLTAASLHKIRDLGLLNVGFLEVLPNSQDGIPERYDGIREAIVDEMNDQPLTPTHSRSHAPAKQLLQARASLKDLLTEEDIKLLVDYDGEQPRWAIGATRNVDRFLAGLKITSWDTDQFVELLCNKTRIGSNHSGPPNNVTSEQVMSWLASKSAEWHQQLYAMLASDYLPSVRYQRPSPLDQLKSLQIVRLSDVSYSVGTKCFFPSDGVEHGEEMARVDKSVYTFGENERQQAAARNFLEEIGVRKVGEVELVEAILLQRYRNESFKPNMADLTRFIELVETMPEQAKLFEAYLIFNRKDRKWSTPRCVFLDAPFLDTGLSAYYESLGDKAPKVALSDSYREIPVTAERLQTFALAVGVQRSLSVTTSPCRSNSSWTELSGGDKHKNHNDSYGRVDFDFDIVEFQKLPSLQTVAASRLIWLTMMKVVKPEQLTARYQRNNYSEPRERSSQLIHRLISTAWVPQDNGRFVRPAEASQDLLPDDFEFARSWPWLKAIRFGEETQKRIEEQSRKNQVAKELGIGEDAIQDAQWFAGLSAEDRQQFRRDHERRQTEPDSSKPQRPEASSRDATRRRERVAVIAKDAPTVDRQFRKRKVRVNWETKKVARTTLRRLNTNDDGQLVCQVCGEEMPFKRDNGLYYFAAVECVRGLDRELPENHIALCPVCAAKFRHANSTPPAELKEAILTANSLVVPVTLARQKCDIYFTEIHLQDLQTALGEVGR